MSSYFNYFITLNYSYCTLSVVPILTVLLYTTTHIRDTRPFLPMMDDVSMMRRFCVTTKLPIMKPNAELDNQTEQANSRRYRSAIIYHNTTSANTPTKSLKWETEETARRHHHRLISQHRVYVFINHIITVAQLQINITLCCK